MATEPECAEMTGALVELAFAAKDVNKLKLFFLPSIIQYFFFASPIRIISTAKRTYTHFQIDPPFPVYS